MSILLLTIELETLKNTLYETLQYII